MTVVLTGTTLVLDDVVRVAREGERVELDPGALERMRWNLATLRKALGCR